MHLDSARVLLDPQSITRRLGAIPALEGRRLGQAELASLWIKPGRHFHASYRLTVADQSRPFLVSAFALGRPRAASTLAELGPHSADDPVCPHCHSAWVPPGLLLQLFPFDYRLPTLPACFAVERVARALGSDVSISGAVPAGYRPGMRCQIRYTTGCTTLYGKVSVEQSPGQAFSRHGLLWAALGGAPHRFRLAAPFRYLPELRLAVMAAAPGENLHDALRVGRDVGADIVRIAEALAHLHGLEIRGMDRVYTIDDELSLIHGWVELVAQWYPELAAALIACDTELRRTRPEPVAPRALVHRDFYDKQILIGPDGLTLLDLDTACRGDPEIDLGNFGAQLVLRGLQFERPDEFRALEESFLSAYRRAAAPERVGWYRRTTLLRLACGYALRPQWHHLAPALIEEARRP